MKNLRGRYTMFCVRFEAYELLLEAFYRFSFGIFR